MTTLEQQFHHAMVGVADFANQHHFGIRFRQMIEQYGAVKAAERLLETHEIQTGLMRLWEMGALDQLFVTNLCNEFLPSPQSRGTVLIPDPLAERGVEAIRAFVSRGNFSLILPMSVQTFYHLCRLGFLDEQDGNISEFTDKARPASRKVDQGVYVSSGKAPFLEVCGQRFHHRGVTLVPILHVKQWPLKTRTVRYTEPMESAKREIRKALAIP